MNTTVCPACRSTDVRPDDPTDTNIDCLACGIWFDPQHPQNQPASPCFGKECYRFLHGGACYGDCPED